MKKLITLLCAILISVSMYSQTLDENARFFIYKVIEKTEAKIVSNDLIYGNDVTVIKLSDYESFESVKLQLETIDILNEDISITKDWNNVKKIAVYKSTDVNVTVEYINRDDNQFIKLYYQSN